MKKLMTVVSLLALAQSSFAANNLNLPDSEYNYLSCFNNMLFKQPSKSQSTKNYVTEHLKLLKSPQFKALFKETKGKQSDDGGDAPNKTTYIPKKSISLLGLPISQIDVSSADWSGGMMNVKLYTPSTYAATQAILEPKFGKFSNYQSNITSGGFGIAKEYQVPNQYDLKSTETYEHSVSLKKGKSGKGTVVSCKVVAAA